MLWCIYEEVQFNITNAEDVIALNKTNMTHTVSENLAPVPFPVRLHTDFSQQECFRKSSNSQQALQVCFIEHCSWGMIHCSH